MGKFRKHFGPLMERDSSSNTNQALWKIKRSFYPKHKTAFPTAKFNHKGRLVTDPEEIKDMTLIHFKNRLRDRPILPGLEQLRTMKENLCQLRINLVNTSPVKPWTMNQLHFVLNSLNKNRSKDPYGLISKLLRPEVIGCDL